jgi:HrpA-like RNA helicase
MSNESKLPTLLRKGYIKPNEKLKLSKSAIAKINNTKGVDYIIDFISDRTPVSAGSNPKIPAKQLGDRVIVLKSDTGSGKSTVMPPSLYEKLQLRTNKNIAVTQPRVLTAIDIAEGLPDNYTFLKLDDNLGYTTGNYKRLPKNKGVIFMTTGTLLAQLKTSETEDFMKKYSFILIDEVHDRSIDVDASLYLLKKLLAENYKSVQCPMLILMSATFDPTIFMDYFGCPDENFIQVIGSTFPIEKNFLKYDTPDFIKYAVDRAEEVHITNISDIQTNSKYRDIIIFVSGAGPTKTILELLHLFNASVLSKPFDKAVEYINNKPAIGGGDPIGGDAHYYIAPIELSSKTFNLSGVDYQNMFSDINSISIPIYKVDNGKIDMKNIAYWVKPSRRVIIATPVAETGVTIETLKYCIDTGYLMAVDFNPDFGVKTIIPKNVTQGMAIQRRGRVGRKSPGVWYPCFTEKTFNSLEVDQFAELLKSDITSELLGVFIKETNSSIVENSREKISRKFIYDNELFLTSYITDRSFYKLECLNQLDISSIDFLESPSASSLVYSCENLYGLGFIDSQYNPTVLGLYANKLMKMTVKSRRMILAGYSHGANIIDLITIVSFIEVERMNIFHRKYTPINVNPKLNEKEYEFYYKIIICDEFIEYLLIWEMYSELLDNMFKKTKSKAKADDNFSFNISDVEHWCLDNKLIYEGLNSVTAMRNEIIESLISMGLNPYWNGLGLEKGTYNLLTIFRNNIDEFISESKKIKLCILDGFRFNLMIWDNSSKKYILHHKNVPVQVRSNVLSRMGDNAVQTNANFIVSSNITLRKSMMNKDIFQFEHTGSISVMDSINIDLEFLKR